MHRAGRFQFLAARAISRAYNIEIALLVVGEVGTDVLTVRRHLGSIPHGHMRIDLALEQPAKHLAGAVGDIPGYATRLQVSTPE